MRLARTIPRRCRDRRRDAVLHHVPRAVLLSDECRQRPSHRGRNHQIRECGTVFAWREPVTSATTFISSAFLVKVTVPSTLLPLVGCRTAIAFVGSCANAVRTQSENCNRRCNKCGEESSFHVGKIHRPMTRCKLSATPYNCTAALCRRAK